MGLSTEHLPQCLHFCKWMPGEELKTIPLLMSISCLMLPASSLHPSPFHQQQSRSPACRACPGHSHVSGLGRFPHYTCGWNVMTFAPLGYIGIYYSWPLKRERRLQKNNKTNLGPGDLLSPRRAASTVITVALMDYYLPPAKIR